jgi:hypothetical protein
VKSRKKPSFHELNTKNVFYLALALFLLQLLEIASPLPLFIIDNILPASIKFLILMFCFGYAISRPDWKEDKFAKSTIVLGALAVLVAGLFFLGLYIWGLPD